MRQKSIHIFFYLFTASAAPRRMISHPSVARRAGAGLSRQTRHARAGVSDLVSHLAALESWLSRVGPRTPIPEFQRGSRFFRSGGWRAAARSVTHTASARGRATPAVTGTFAITVCSAWSSAALLGELQIARISAVLTRHQGQLQVESYMLAGPRRAAGPQHEARRGFAAARSRRRSVTRRRASP